MRFRKNQFNLGWLNKFPIELPVFYQTMKRTLYLISLICFSYGNFITTTYGQTWKEVNNGIPNNFSKVYSIAVSGKNIFAADYGNGVFFSINMGDNWTAMNNGMTSNHGARALVISGTNIFAGIYDQGGVFLSSDNANNWTDASNGITDKQINSFAVMGRDIFVATRGGVFLSSDSGANWTSAGLANLYAEDLLVKGTAIFASAGATGGSIYLSNDKGANWTDVGINGLPLAGSSINAIILKGSTIYAGIYQHGVFMSADDGASWTAINNGLTDLGLTTMFCDGTNLFAGTWEGGVFVSCDNGASWTAFNDGLTFKKIYSFGLCENNLFAGTYGGGIWKADLSSISPAATINRDTTICAGNPILLKAAAGIGYLWSTGETTATINVSPASPTTYTVAISFAAFGNCLSKSIETTSVNIGLTSITISENTSISIGNTTILTASPGAGRYVWSPSSRLTCETCSSTNASPNQTTTYTLTYTDSNGCSSNNFATIYVDLCGDIFVPSAFSPNGDGQNDTLYIRGKVPCIADFEFVIYNRWGVMVYESQNISSGWDGNYMKSPLNTGIFFYWLNATLLNKPITLKGNISLLR